MGKWYTSRLLVDIDEVRGQQVGREVLLTPILEEEGGEYDIPRYIYDLSSQLHDINIIHLIFTHSSFLYIILYRGLGNFFYGPRTPILYGILLYS
jgi:hypothetical protein